MWETSVNSCGPRHPECETRVGDKWKTSVNSCGPRHPECETSVGDKWETSVNSCGPRHPEWETSVGDKCKLMRPKAPRVGDKCEGEVGDKCGPRHPEWETSVGHKWKTSVNSCGRTHPSVRDKWETSVKKNHSAQGTLSGRQVEDKCKLMRPKAPRVRDKCGRQVGDKCRLMRPKATRVGDMCGRQVGNKWETSANSRSPRHHSGRQVWETSVGDTV